MAHIRRAQQVTGGSPAMLAADLVSGEIMLDENNTDDDIQIRCLLTRFMRAMRAPLTADDIN